MRPPNRPDSMKGFLLDVLFWTVFFLVFVFVLSVAFLLSRILWDAITK